MTLMYGGTIVTEVPWISAYAASRGFRYEPDAEEAWLRAWEPFRTMKVALRYEHALHGTGSDLSVTLARMIVTVPAIRDPSVSVEHATWVGIAQDPQVTAEVAIASDRHSAFREDPSLVSLPPLSTGDPQFDAVFSTFGRDPNASSLTPSLRRLLLSFQTPLHAELRPGGFIFAPVSLGFDPQSLAWLDRSMFSFAEKASKH